MLIYNVTIKIDWSIADAWLAWMKDVYMPLMNTTGCFERQQLVRLLDVDDDEGPTYAAQYYVSSHKKYEQYLNQFSIHLNSQATSLWGNKYIAFKSLMEIVE